MMTLLIIGTSFIFIGFLFSFVSYRYIPENISFRDLALFNFSASLWALSTFAVALFPGVLLGRGVFAIAVMMAYFLERLTRGIALMDNSFNKKLSIISLALFTTILLTDWVILNFKVIDHSLLSEFVFERNSLFYLACVSWIVYLGYVSLRNLNTGAKINNRLVFLRNALILGTMSALLTNVILPALMTTSKPNLFAFVAQFIWVISFTIYSLNGLSNSRNVELQKNRDKDEFISFASHQLRTPLSVASINNKLLLEGAYGKLNPEQKTAIVNSQYSIDRMGEIIESLLEAARIDEGKFKLHKTKFDIKKALDELIKTAESRAKQSKISIKYECGISENQVIFADRTRILEVISIFIDNSIKYSTSNKLIRVKAGVVDSYFEVNVIDQGRGIMPKDRERIFQKFERSQVDDHSNPEGLGLGLYLAKKTIEAHQGELIFKSRLGEGSTFGFRIAIGDNS